MPNMIRILLADDQNLVRQGIKSLLEQDLNFHIVGTVKNGHDALEQVELLSPDIVLLDIEMPGMDGITATKYINHSSPQIKVIILSSHEGEEYLIQAFMAGAKAYMLKDSLMTDLKQAILAVNNGYSQIESRLLAKILNFSNIQFYKSKSEAENQKIDHHRQSNDFAVEIPLRENPEYEQTEEKSIISVYSVKQPLLSPGEVSEVNVSEPIIFKNPESEVNLSNLNLAKTINQNNVVEVLQSNHNHNNSQFNHNTRSKFNEEKNLPIANQFLFLPHIQGSAAKLNSTSTSTQTQILKVILQSKNYLQKITNKPPFLKYKIKIAQFYQSKALQYEPQIKFCQAKLGYYQSRLCPIIKHWHETGLLANAGLVFLGIITVLIIHQVFSS